MQSTTLSELPTVDYARLLTEDRTVTVGLRQAAIDLLDRCNRLGTCWVWTGSWAGNGSLPVLEKGAYSEALRKITCELQGRAVGARRVLVHAILGADPPLEEEEREHPPTKRVLTVMARWYPRAQCGTSRCMAPAHIGLASSKGGPAIIMLDQAVGIRAWMIERSDPLNKEEWYIDCHAAAEYFGLSERFLRLLFGCPPLVSAWGTAR